MAAVLVAWVAATSSAWGADFDIVLTVAACSPWDGGVRGDRALWTFAESTYQRVPMPSSTARATSRGPVAIIGIQAALHSVQEEVAPMEGTIRIIPHRLDVDQCSTPWSKIDGVVSRRRGWDHEWGDIIISRFGTRLTTLAAIMRRAQFLTPTFAFCVIFESEAARGPRTIGAVKYIEKRSPKRGAGGCQWSSRDIPRYLISGSGSIRDGAALQTGSSAVCPEAVASWPGISRAEW